MRVEGTGSPHIKRRQLVKLAIGATILPAVMRFGPAHATGRPIRIGFVSPQTGPLAAFGEPVTHTLERMTAALKDGIQVNGETHPVEILSRDSQSNSNRAAEVASDLILRNEVDLLLAFASLETVIPAANQAEINGTPCISTVCPWQPYVFGRNGDPKVGFEWTYHFFWGLEDATASKMSLWNQIETNKVVGALCPNDADGLAWINPKNPGALPQTCERNGFKLIDGGRFTPGIEDYSAQIAQFQREGVEIVCGVLTPPDFTLFWQQAAQQQFRPKIVTVAKALLFPSVIEAIGDRADGLSTEMWWSPNHPFTSGFNGQSAAEIAQDYSEATGRPWTQPLGFCHALFEVAVDVLKRTGDIDDPSAILESIKSTNYNSVVGPVRWDNPELKNISKVPVISGQWTKIEDRFELVVCDNHALPQVPVGAKLRPLA